MQVQVDAPRNAAGATLDDIEIGVVGYVPIDYPTNYYSTKTAAWVRKYPASPPACDGWAGYWPDPLLPRDTFDLQREHDPAGVGHAQDRRGRCPRRLHRRGPLHVRRRRDRPRAVHRPRLGLRSTEGEPRRGHLRPAHGQPVEHPGQDARGSSPRLPEVHGGPPRLSRHHRPGAGHPLRERPGHRRLRGLRQGGRVRSGRTGDDALLHALVLLPVRLGLPALREVRRETLRGQLSLSPVPTAASSARSSSRPTRPSSRSTGTTSRREAGTRSACCTFPTSRSTASRTSSRR